MVDRKHGKAKCRFVLKSSFGQAINYLSCPEAQLVATVRGGCFTHQADKQTGIPTQAAWIEVARPTNEKECCPPPPGHFPSAIHLEQWWVRASKCALINNLECIQRKTHNNESDQKYVKRGIVEAIQMEKERQRWDICLEVLGSHYIFMETDLACRSLEHRTPMSGRNLPGRQFGSIERKTPAIQSYPMLREAGLRSLEGLRVWI